jgi:hypothetical protein
MPKWPSLLLVYCLFSAMCNGNSLGFMVHLNTAFAPDISTCLTLPRRFSARIRHDFEIPAQCVSSANSRGGFAKGKTRRPKDPFLCSAHHFASNVDERDYRDADLWGQRLFVTGLAATVHDAELFLGFEGNGGLLEARVVKPGAILGFSVPIRMLS